MLWCDFSHKLKKLHPKLWINFSGSVPHEDKLAFGVYCGPHHVCGVVKMDVIPRDDVYDDKGVIRVKGLKSILREIFEGVEDSARNLSEHWRMQGRVDLIRFKISPEKIRKIFGMSLEEIYGNNHKAYRLFMSKLKTSDWYNTYTI